MFKKKINYKKKRRDSRVAAIHDSPKGTRAPLLHLGWVGLDVPKSLSFHNSHDGVVTTRASGGGGSCLELPLDLGRHVCLLDKITLPSLRKKIIYGARCLTTPGRFNHLLHHWSHILNQVYLYAWYLAKCIVLYIHNSTKIFTIFQHST